MRTKEYLELALVNGLMLTDHEVRYAPASDQAEWSYLLHSIFPPLIARLNVIGAPWESLSNQHQNVLLMLLGTITGSIPMLCFTEIPEGRILAQHHLSFGAYGLVVKREWVESNGGDRVIYIGNSSAVSRRLYTVIAKFLINDFGLSPKSSNVGFMGSPTTDVIELLSYIEARENIAEAEWRIAGKHGLTGGERDVLRRIPLLLDQVEVVLVQNLQDVEHFEMLIERLSKTQGSEKVPPVLWQPSTV